MKSALVIMFWSFVLVAAGTGGISAALIWCIWSKWGIGEKFFSFLPSAWHAPGFLEWWALLIIVEIVRLAVSGIQTTGSKK